MDADEEVRRLFHEFGCEDIEFTSFEQLGQIHRRPVGRDRTFVIHAKVSHDDKSIEQQRPILLNDL